MRKRRLPWVTLAIATCLGASALLWWAFAVPRLVKYPTDLDVTPRYHGTFTLFVDPTTAAPLATPLQVPTRDRASHPIARRREQLFSRRGRGDHHAAGRRPRRCHPDERLRDGPANDAKRGGRPCVRVRTCRTSSTGQVPTGLNLPFDTSSSSTYAIYKNEIGTTYDDARRRRRHRSRYAEGLHLRNFVGSATEVPLDDAYLAELNEVVSLPDSMTLEQLEAAAHRSWAGHRRCTRSARTGDHPGRSRRPRTDRGRSRSRCGTSCPSRARLRSRRRPAQRSTSAPTNG